MHTCLAILIELELELEFNISTVWPFKVCTPVSVDDEFNKKAVKKTTQMTKRHLKKCIL